MAKSAAKGKKGRGKGDTPKKPPELKVLEDPPLVGLGELARLAGVSDQNILDMRTDPHAPPAHGGKYPRLSWLQYIANVKIYGRRAVKSMDPSELHTAITGTITGTAAGEPGAAQSGGPAPPTEDELKTLAAATTTHELMRAGDKALIKFKTAEEVIQRRLANQERRGRLIPKAVVEEVFFSRANNALAIARKMVLELPPKLVGMDRPDIEQKLSQAFDEFFATISKLGEPVTEGAPSAAAPEAQRANDAKRESPGT